MFSATDVANFLACQHIATLDRAEDRKEVTKPFFADPTVDLLRKLGFEHEQRYLRQLAEKDRLTVVQIDVNGSWEAAVSETVQAMRRGADAIYQATFLDAPWGGRSDFLVRVNKPSEAAGSACIRQKPNRAAYSREKLLCQPQRRHCRVTESLDRSRTSNWLIVLHVEHTIRSLTPHWTKRTFSKPTEIRRFAMQQAITGWRRLRVGTYTLS
jgi:hypothetical protein